MIKLILKRLGRTVELQLPTEYEHVLIVLWKLGLDRDPAKYTLRELGVVFSYDTPNEHQMIRLISTSYTLLDALIMLHQMMSPPYPIAARVRAKILSGSYHSGAAFLVDSEQQTDDEAFYEVEYYFPISGELVDRKGNVKKAPGELLFEYEKMINMAVRLVQLQAIHCMPALFSDVEGVYQMLLSARWQVEKLEDRLIGRIVMFFTEPLTEDEASDAAEKIEMINSVDFAIRLKQWSVLTDQGLLSLYLCDRNGDYSVIPPDELDEYEPCVCPECQERLHQQG